jgi:hypothetical protein
LVGEELGLGWFWFLGRKEVMLCFLHIWWHLTHRSSGASHGNSSSGILSSSRTRILSSSSRTHGTISSLGTSRTSHGNGPSKATINNNSSGSSKATLTITSLSPGKGISGSNYRGSSKSSSGRRNCHGARNHSMSSSNINNGSRSSSCRGQPSANSSTCQCRTGIVQPGPLLLPISYHPGACQWQDQTLVKQTLLPSALPLLLLLVVLCLLVQVHNCQGHQQQLGGIRDGVQ